MLFTSLTFIVFVAAVFLIYYLPPLRQHQPFTLVAASVSFYAIDQATMLPLLIAAVGGTYLLLRGVVRGDKWSLIAGIAFNLGLLAFFKYKFLFIGATDVHTSIRIFDYLLALPLPIGISFFVFHNISLLVDASVKRSNLPSLRNTFLYIIFFPQLVSGPIARSFQFLPQIEPKKLKDVPLSAAGRWIISGYFFKLFAANNLNQIATLMDAPAQLGGLDRIILMFVYSFQIYSDFFGYSAIAIGIALLFGYKLPINFNLPYISTSFSEFWTRWHISLSTWLRTYLYIPLGGNRHGEVRTYINLMIVMMLGGLWHGAALSYITWGTVHGLLLVIERPFLKRETALYGDGGAIGLMARALRIAMTFVLVSFAWAFFKFPDFATATNYLSGILTTPFAANMPGQYYWLIGAFSAPSIIQHLCHPLTKTKAFRIAEPIIYGGMLALAITEQGPAAPFIYFQF